MAKGARKSAARRGRVGKAQAVAGGKGQSIARRGGGKARGGSRQGAGQFELPDAVFGLVGALAGSVAGRLILADALEAAAGVLRKTREGVGQAAEQGVEAASRVADVTTEAVSGTVNLAQTAAGVLAEMATSAARSMLPGSSGEDDDQEDRGSRRGRR
jgi:hypothetical protein